MSPILLFLKVTVFMLLAEMGDKTQLLLVAMAAKYKLRDILLGTLAAEILLNAMAVGLGSVLGGIFADYLGYIKLLAAALFLFFALKTVWGGEEEDESERQSRSRSGFFIVFTSFFLAELGDKTQLTALTFGATEGSGIGAILAVFFGCCLGLYASDMLGVAVGLLLKKKLPEKLLFWLSFGLFGIFGIVTACEGFGLLFTEKLTVWLCTLGAALLFAAASLALFLRKKRHA